VQICALSTPIVAYFSTKRKGFIKVLAMFVKKLSLYNFRNYANEEILFDDGLNILVGENAQGKTNAIEGIYLLATGTSPRISSDRELIMLGKNDARICAEVETSSGDIEVEMALSRSTKKCAKINGLVIAKIGELIGNVRVVYFSPDEMSLIKDSPDFRRRFMDVDLSQINRNYFYTLNKYTKILRQRNTLLKDSDEKKVKETIAVWDEQLAREGAKLVVYRKEFCEVLSKEAKIVHDKIATDEDLSVSYYTLATGKTEKEIAESIEIALLTNRDRDMHLGFTSVGPQRDDLKITLNGIDLRTFGSQGQQRTATLSLKLAEINIFEKLTGEKPILILDDVMSELDRKRRARLMQACKGGQTIITTTETADLYMEESNVIKVQNGKVI